jgi:hypothetical protein
MKTREEDEIVTISTISICLFAGDHGLIPVPLGGIIAFESLCSMLISDNVEIFLLKCFGVIYYDCHCVKLDLLLIFYWLQYSKEYSQNS